MHTQVKCNNCSLDNICLPRGLSSHEINHISNIVKARKTLQRGEFLYRQGDQFSGVLAIKSGSAKLVADDSHGNEHILDILLPGELLGFDGISKNLYHCSAIALETSSFCLLPAHSIDQMITHVPGLARELFRHSGDKINNNNIHRVMAKRPAEERLAFFLIELSERLKTRGFSSKEFTLSLTRQEIGNHLGLALETVSRILKKFQQQGIIQVKNKAITIKKQDALRAILQPVESDLF